MKRITIIGIGMGNIETLTLEGKKYIDSAEVLIGARRMVEAVNTMEKPVFLSFDSKAIRDYIYASEYSNYGVLMSGDTGFFSGANALMSHLKDVEVKVIPGISSLSYFCAKIKTSWEDAYLLSTHGRKSNIVPAVQQHKKTFVLTDGGISTICEKLSQAGLGHVRVCAGENLSYETERIIDTKACDLIGQQFASTSVMMIFNPEYKRQIKIGMEEEAFIRGEVPMTKSEIRAISISKLDIKEDSVIYDIGAGTGSVSVEMAILAAKGKVYAIEQKEEAVHLIERNRDKFFLENMEVIHGMAPAALEPLPRPDIAFIGGSKGNMDEILNVLLQKNPGIQILVNAITLETLSETLTLLQNKNFKQIDMVQAFISKAKKAGSYHMMMGQNPVFIISGRGNGYGEC